MGHAGMGLVVKNALDRGDGQCQGGGCSLKEEEARGRKVSIGEIYLKSKVFQPRDLLHKDSRERKVLLLNMY